MKRLILAGIGTLAVMTLMGSANAADLPRRYAMPTKAPAYEAPYTWTGFYIGINGGGGWGRSDWDAFGTGFNTSGGLVGGTLGYNYQMGQVVLGLEGDGDWSDLHGSGVCAGVSCETRNHWLATARGRAGYSFGRVLPYITGGAAFGDVKSSRVGFGSDTTTRAGWTLGGGAEVTIAGPWSAKIEYLHVDLGKSSCDAVACGVPTDVSFTSDIVRGGINYRF